MTEDHKPTEQAAPQQPQTVTAMPAPSSKLISTPQRTLIFMLIILLLGIALILWAWRIGPFHNSIESTENSYVKGKTTVLSSQINGYVKDVLVSDFDHVKKGQVLMHIDATTYDQKVTQA